MSEKGHWGNEKQGGWGWAKADAESGFGLGARREGGWWMVRERRKSCERGREGEFIFGAGMPRTRSITPETTSSISERARDVLKMEGASTLRRKVRVTGKVRLTLASLSLHFVREFGPFLGYE